MDQIIEIAKKWQGGEFSPLTQLKATHSALAEVEMLQKGKRKVNRLQLQLLARFLADEIGAETNTAHLSEWAREWGDTFIDDHTFHPENDTKIGSGWLSGNDYETCESLHKIADALETDEKLTPEDIETLYFHLNQ